MKRNHTIYLIFLFIITVVVLVAGYLTVNTKRNNFSTRSHAAPPLTSPVPLITQSTTFSTDEQVSPDGQVKLMMQVQFTSYGTREYTFFTMDKTEELKREVYTSTLTQGAYFIPFNSWSPDNRYFFIQKNTGEVLVFTITGESITPDEQFFDVKGIYTQIDRTDMFDTVTGWASPTLLIIRTKKIDGTRGNSYWFEVPDKAIIQLSGDF